MTYVCFQLQDITLICVFVCVRVHVYVCVCMNSLLLINKYFSELKIQYHALEWLKFVHAMLAAGV